MQFSGSRYKPIRQDYKTQVESLRLLFIVVGGTVACLYAFGMIP